MSETAPEGVYVYQPHSVARKDGRLWHIGGLPDGMTRHEAEAVAKAINNISWLMSQCHACGYQLRFAATGCSKCGVLFTPPWRGRAAMPAPQPDPLLARAEQYGISSGELRQLAFLAGLRRYATEVVATTRIGKRAHDVALEVWRRIEAAYPKISPETWSRWGRDINAINDEFCGRSNADATIEHGGDLVVVAQVEQEAEVRRLRDLAAVVAQVEQEMVHASAWNTALSHSLKQWADTLRQARAGAG